VDARDHTFVGGWVGAGARSLWVPAHWAALPAPALVAQLVRRRATRDLGLHARGVALALAWNAAGLALVLGPLAADVRTAAGAVAAVAWGVLWSFLGLLVLPTPSRRGVYRVDAAAARAVGGASTRDAILRLDAWQDAESRRAPGVEAIFHPVPAAGHRVAALAGAEAETAGAAHHAARHALYLAWAQGSPLARAVHCNVGRPALWVVWPGD
jgi:hypothetical protein